MAISRIKTDGIQDDAVTSPKFADNPDFDGQFVRVPHGTTAQRPAGAAAGYMRFNTTVGTLEQFNTNTNSWQAIDSPPIITGVVYSGSATGVDPAGGDTMTVNGSNFQSGASVSVGGTSATSVSFVSSTQITFVLHQRLLVIMMSLQQILMDLPLQRLPEFLIMVCLLSLLPLEVWELLILLS